ncbi:MAG: glycosyltransferase [Chloroflexota bacterium]
MSLVSVIIPTFNRVKFIEQTLNSVFAQTYSPLEIIVVDNGSTDGTLQKLESFQDRIIVAHEPKSGMGGSHARNRGLELATGEYIAFLDSDDLWMPAKIEKQVKFLEQHPEFGWCYTDLIGFDSNSGRDLYQYSKTRTMHTGYAVEQAFVQIFTPLSTLLIKQEVMAKVGRFWPTPKGTDAELAVRLAAEAPVGFLPEVLVRYRVHEDSVTGTISGQQAFEAGKRVKERAVELFPDQLAPMLDPALASVATAVGLNLLKNGQKRKARQMFGKAIGYQRSNPTAYLYYLSTFLNPSILQSLNQRRKNI